MADADRCAACGDIIPEGVQICPICRRKEIFISEQEAICACGLRHISPRLKPPTVEEVRRAAKIIKAFCKSRGKDPETDCIECPIKDICYNEPYLWEV